MGSLQGVQRRQSKEIWDAAATKSSKLSKLTPPTSAEMPLLWNNIYLLSSVSLCALLRKTLSDTLAVTCFSPSCTAWQRMMTGRGVQNSDDERPGLIRSWTRTRSGSEVKLVAILKRPVTSRRALSTPTQTSRRCLATQISE